METVTSNQDKPEESHNIQPEPVSKLAQESGAKLTRERKRTVKLMESLPKGITITERRDGRPKPFIVRYGTPRKSEGFVTEGERNDFTEQLADLMREKGTSALAYTREKWTRFEEWLATQDKPILTVNVAVENYIKLRLGEDVKERGDVHGHMKTRLGKFVAHFHLLSLDAITTDQLRTWFKDLKNPRERDPEDPTKLAAMGKVTLRHYRKEVNRFFKRAIEEQWIGLNPFEAVKAPKVDAKKKRPLSAKDIFHLLQANRNKPIIGRLALEIWGCLRSSAAGDLRKPDLDFEKRSIFIGRIKVKDQETLTAGGKTRQGHFPVLWEWLQKATAECWSMAPSYYDTAKTLAFARADVENPGNALRHSGVSYYLALWKDYKRVGYMFLHTDVRTTMGYEGASTEEDANLVMRMTPQALVNAKDDPISWEEFLASNKTK